MENNMVDSVFKGMLNPEVHEQVVELENLLRNSGTNQMSLYIESDDLLKLEEFSKNIIELLKGMNLISYPARRPLSLFLKQYLMTKTINCVVIDAIEENEINKDKWELLKQNLKDSHIFTIFLTTKEHGDVLRKQYSNDFFNTFDFVIRLKPYSISEIISGADYALENSGLTYDEKTFLPAYEEWIRTVYHRADLQGEAFVEGIIKRLIRQSMKLNQDGNVTPESIPVYWKRELSEDVQKDIEDKYSKYTSIKTILNLVQTNKEHDASRNTYNLCIETNNDSLVKDFARDYARLLNSQNYDVIYSTFVEEVDVRKLIEMDNLQNQHGLIVVKGLDDLDLEEETSKASLDCLLENISNSKNDLVWIVNTKLDCIKDKLESFKFIEKAPSKINVDKQECDINEIITILGKSQSNEFSHEIYVNWNGKDEKIASVDSGKNSFEHAYTIPLSFANDLPNQTEGKVSFRLDTYYNGEFIGSDTTSNIRVIIPETYKSVIELVEVVKEDGSKLDEFEPNKDRLKFKIHVNGSCGATIKSIQTSLEGKTYFGEEFITDPPEHGGELNYKVEIVDSRNRVTTKTGSINVKEVEKQVEEKLDPIMHPDFLKVQEKENKLQELVKDIKSNPNEKNVLLLAMSIISREKQVSKYAIDNSIKDLFNQGNAEGSYVYQLEPVPKMLVEELAKNNEKLDYIYALNTYKSKNTKTYLTNGNDKSIYYSDEYKEYTAFEYFQERCSKIIDKEDIIDIPVEKEINDADVSMALYNFTTELVQLTKKYKVNLYVDLHGGFRETATVLDAILMLIKDINNIELKDVYSIEYPDSIGTIKSVKRTSNIYDFVGGMQEFLSFGRSNGLIKYVEEEMEKESNDNELHEKNQALVDAINMFSDGISLNQAGLFSDRLSELADKVNCVSYEKNFGIVKQLISNNYVVYIDKIENKNGEQSRYDLLGIERNYLPAQLKWCLDKDLLQQTLTLIESVMIESLINEGIVSYPERVNDFKKAFDDWVNLSLFKFECDGQVRVVKEGTVEREMEERDSMSYFDGYTEFFCGMDEKLAVQGKSKHAIENEILREILDHRNYGMSPTKYYESCKFSIYQSCSKGIKTGYIDRRNNSVKYNKYYLRTNIPLVKALRNNSDYVNEFYKLLFIHRGLKMYRNKVSHANAEESIRLSKDDLKRWIELYIEVLDKLMRDAKVLLKK